MKSYTNKLFLILIILLSSVPLTFVQSQNLTLPRASQQAKVKQRIGITDLAVVYHSPAVKDRKIWGKLVPFNTVWRAGANENTLFYSSHDITIGGQALAAGKYGLYMIPSEESVKVILSSAIQNWGTVAPTEDEIVVQFETTPKTIEHQEWLSYEFVERNPSSATLALKWANWMIPMKIEVDVQSIVYENLQAELKGVSGFGFQGKQQAAAWCLQNGIAYDQALTWIDQSIQAEKRFSNLMVKSQLLAKTGKAEESDKLAEKALVIATPVQMNLYGYQLLNSGDAEAATKIFLKNIESCPKDHAFYWGFVDSVGEGYLKSGDKANALKYYKKAKEYAPENRHAYLDGVISGIEESL